MRPARESGAAEQMGSALLPLARHRRRARAVGDRQRDRWRRPALAVQDLGGRASCYILEPFDKRGELDQGILRFTWYSLVLVAKGYALALLIGTPLGFLLGALEDCSRKAFDPIIQILRPVSPLAWLPLGLVLFQKLGAGRRSSPSPSARCGRRC